MKEIIITGAGISGLCTGIRLLSAGFHVSIYEKQHVCGGTARTLLYHANNFDYYCDSFASIPVNPQDYKTIFQDAGLLPESYFQTIPLTDIYKIFNNTGESYNLTTHYSLQPQEFEAFFQEPISHYNNLINKYYAHYNTINHSFMSVPLTHMNSIFKKHTLATLQKLMPWKKTAQVLSHYINSPILKEFILYQTLYMGMSPYLISHMYLTIPACTQIEGFTHIKGGTGAYARALATAFTNLGGKLITNTPVEKIIINKKTANGIQVHGTTIPADAVFICSDIHHATKSLLPAHSMPFRLRTTQLKKSMSCSVFILRLVFKNKLTNLSIHNIFLSGNFLSEMMRLEQNRIPENPPLYIYYPASCDSSFVKNGFTSMNIIMRVPNLSSTIIWDNTLTKKLRDICIHSLKIITSSNDIEQNIVKEFYSAPNDLLQNFNCSQGAAFGLSPDLLHSLFFRPQSSIKKLENVYFAGTSIHPGNGISNVMKSASNASKCCINKFIP